MKLIERLYDYFEANGIRPTALEKELGLSNGYFGKQKDRNASIGSDILEKIAYKFPDLDLHNLIAGKPVEQGHETILQKLGEPEVQYNAIKKGQPYYDMDVSVGLVKLFSDKPSISPHAYIYIPGFEDCSGYINVYGDAMEGAYNPGDIIAYKLLSDKKIIQYGQPYLVVTKTDVYFRYIKKSPDNIFVELHAHNTFHDPFNIEVDTIRYLAIVKGKIQRNSI